MADLSGRLTRWRTETGDNLPSETDGNSIAHDFMTRYQRQLDKVDVDHADRSLPSRRTRAEERELRNVPTRHTQHSH